MFRFTAVVTEHVIRFASQEELRERQRDFMVKSGFPIRTRPGECNFATHKEPHLMGGAMFDIRWTMTEPFLVKFNRAEKYEAFMQKGEAASLYHPASFDFGGAKIKDFSRYMDNKRTELFEYKC